GNDRTRRVTHRDRLDLAAVVATFIGGRVGPFDYELIDARAGVSLVAVSDDRDSPAVVRSHDGAVVRWRNRAGAGDDDVDRDAGEDGRVGVADSNRLDQAVCIAAGVCSNVSPFDGKFVRAGAGNGLVAMGNRWYTTTIIGGDDSAIVGHRHIAGALDR